VKLKGTGAKELGSRQLFGFVSRRVMKRGVASCGHHVESGRYWRLRAPRNQLSSTIYKLYNPAAGRVTANGNCE
jgi:hypothetical protein